MKFYKKIYDSSSIRKLFIKYANNNCSKNPVGINTFGRMPVDVAQFLKLPDIKYYTGRCFCRASATVLVDAGANLVTIKRHEGWKFLTVVAGYIENFLENKKNIRNQILSIN